MYKRWRCYVALLLCLCCTFATLSLNTLQVKAWGNLNFSYTQTVYFTYTGGGNYSSTTGFINSNSGGNGSFTNGNGVISSISGGGGTISTQILESGSVNYHFKIPVNLIGDFSSISYSPNKDDYIRFLINAGTISFTSTGEDFVAENIGIYDSEGKLLTAYKDRLYWCFDTVKCSDIWDSANGTQFSYPCILEFDIVCEEFNFNTIKSSNMTWSAAVGIWPGSVDDVSAPVSDSGTQNRLDTQIQQETTAQTTRTGILNQITSFFGSFFENIINALKSLFIPEDGYFTNWFTRLNTLLSAKLGMLYAPFDLVISVLTALGSASTSEAGIPFPELSWDGQVIIPAQTFYFSSLGSSFNDLRDAVYFGTDVVLLFAFLVLLQRKINLVMRGSEEG